MIDSIPSAIVRYKQGNYKVIQEYLRNGTIPPNKKKEDMEALVSQISAAMKTGNPVHPGAFLYRGTSISELGVCSPEDVGGLRNQELIWKGFVSTSIDENCAYNFIQDRAGNGLLLRIQPMEATRFYDLSDPNKLRLYLKHVTTEKEILLDRNTHFVVDAVSDPPETVRPKKYCIVDVHLVDNHA